MDRALQVDEQRIRSQRKYRKWGNGCSLPFLLVASLWIGCGNSVDIGPGEACDFSFSGTAEVSRTVEAKVSGLSILDDRDPDCVPDIFNPGWNCNPYTILETHPSWSPDGRRISYISDTETGKVGLFVHDLVTGSDRLVGVGPSNASSQAWSPDGKWLTFSMARQIWKTTVSGDCVVQLTFDGENFEPAWSPEGKWIAYTSTVAPKQTGIFLIDVERRSEEWRFPADFPTWSSSGEHVIGVQGVGAPTGGNRLLRFPMTAGKPVDTLDVFPGQIIHSTDASPRDEFIVFRAQLTQGVDINIWRVRNDGSDLQRVTRGGGDDPAWSPDGTTIAFSNISKSEGKGRIWLMDRDGSNRRPLRNTDSAE